MNSEKDILTRLLKSFPVNLLKEIFDKSGLKQDNLIEEIVNENNYNTIQNFTFQHFGYTKQHVYLYKIGCNLPNNLLLPVKNNPDFTNNIDNGKELGYLVTIQYHFFNIAQNEEQSISFLCPVLVKKKGDIAMLCISILERKVDSYIKDKIVNLGKDIEEKNIVEYFENNISINHYNLSRIDLTKGIKEIWKEDYIDSPYAKFKKSKSTSTEVMDEEYTLKNQYPDIYDEIMKGPIDRTIFKFLNSNGFVSRFRVEPSIGKLTFGLYPDDNQSIWNTINLITSKNF